MEENCSRKSAHNSRNENFHSVTN